MSIRFSTCHGLLGAAGLVLAALPGVARGESPVQQTILKVENFAKDPRWEGRNNRIVSTQKRLVTQSFGYSATHFAGIDEGEMGGQIQRASMPAYYADAIGIKTLDDQLSASGSFAVTASSAGGGVFIGYFDSHQPGSTERPVASLGLHLDFESNGARLSMRLITSGGKDFGASVTRPALISNRAIPANLPIKNDGTRYQWKLTYDPQANHNEGRFQFVVKRLGAGGKHDLFESQVFSCDVPAGFKKDGAKFDRFGMMNLLSPGGAATLFCDDLQYDGKAEDFSIDPGWINAGNRLVSEDREQAGAHDFGFSPGTTHAGGSGGEIGGVFWRTSSGWAQYADAINAVNLGQPLEATGKVILIGARPESDLYLGWFNNSTVDAPPAQGKNFLGIRISGSARLGQTFAPSYATAKGTVCKTDKAPSLVSGVAYAWSISYDPTGNKGAGELRVTLGDESVSLPFKAAHQSEGGFFDRFGLFTGYPAGSMMKVYFDDLSYSVGGNVQLGKDGLGKN